MNWRQWVCAHEDILLRVDATPGFFVLKIAEQATKLSGGDPRYLLGVTNYVIQCRYCNRLKIIKTLGGGK